MSDNTSKFEQMRSRRHMLNNIGTKPASKRDSNLIGGGKPIKPQTVIPKEAKGKSELTPIGNTSSAFAKNASKVVGLEIDKFKDWTGLSRENNPQPIIKTHTTPQATGNKASLSSGFVFNNDRHAIGSSHLSQASGIIRKEDRDPMNVRDIDGASSKVKSYIMNKLHNKKSSVDNFFKNSASLGNGMRYDYLDGSSDRTFDTKRFMRVDDITGAKPVNKQAVTDGQKEFILSNSPKIEQAYQNSEYFRKQKERQGKLPFTRRVNKGSNLMDKSLVSSIDPYTGEKLTNPYMNISLDRPNERMRRNLSKQADDSIEYTNNVLQDMRAKRMNSKRSHKLGLSKDYDSNQR